MRKLLVLVVPTLFAALGIAAGSPAASAAGAAPAACTGTVQITSMTFSPPSVTAGQGSTATLTTQNCTGQTVATTETWFAQLLNFGPVPGTCIAFDPIPFGRTYQPNQAATRTVGFGTFPACTASLLRATVRITNSADGTLLATQTADLQISVPATCSGVVQIKSMAFSPPSVTAGQGSTVTLVTQNCTSQTQTTSETWFGQFMGGGTGIPTGCVAIDPLALPATYAPNETRTRTFGFSTFASCTAALLRATVRITSSADGSTLATQTADLQVTQRPACTVTYTRQSEWQGGFVAGVTVTNNSTAPVTGWTVGFSFGGDQQITNAWSAVVTESAPAVSAVNADYNRTIPAGGSVMFGFLGSWRTSDAPPTTFTLNGATCTTG
jgi:plastocyanin